MAEFITIEHSGLRRLHEYIPPLTFYKYVLIEGPFDRYAFIVIDHGAWHSAVERMLDREWRKSEGYHVLAAGEMSKSESGWLFDLDPRCTVSHTIPEAGNRFKYDPSKNSRHEKVKEILESGREIEFFYLNQLMPEA